MSIESTQKSPGEMMNDALARAEASLADRLSTMDAAELRDLSQSSRNEAGDTSFTNEHRMRRFALHLLAESEIDRRAAADLHAFDAEIAAMSDDELAAFEARMAENTHTLQ